MTSAFTASTASTVDIARTMVDLVRPMPAGDDAFLGRRAALGLPRIFGGQVLAQGLVAAARTVTKPAHSLHAYFLRAGDPEQPVEYRVGRLRDGRRLASRSVSAEQGGTVIATMIASFADTTGTVAHQRRPPTAVPPTDLPTLEEATRAWGGLSPSWTGFDLVEIRVDPRQATVHDDLPQWTDQVWQRIREPLPADPELHRAMLAYTSDIVQLAAALVPQGVALGREEVDGRLWDGVSLDHAMWFHRPVRADEWLLFEQCSPVAASGRAFTRTEVFTAAGELVASIVQEGLVFDPVEVAPPPTTAS
jgi:acyl-CoA thioesterase-2